MRRHAWLAAFAGALVVGTEAVAADALPPPPPEIGALRLPDGSLQPVSRSDGAAYFLEAGWTKRSRDQVEVTVLEIYDPGIPTAYGKAVQVVARATIDCRRRARTLHGAVAFDEAERMVMWLPAEEAEPIEAGSTTEFQARVVCDSETPPSGPVTGHAAALAAGRAVLRAGRR